MPKAEASVTPARALGTTLRTYQVGLKQPPPCRFVPWAMHTEGQRTLLTWRIDALYYEPKIRSTCDIFRGPGDHLHTFQVGLKQPQPRRLCPERVKGCQTRANYPASGADRRPVTFFEVSKHLPHPCQGP